MLCKHGANYNFIEPTGSTILHLATRKKNHDALQYIFESLKDLDPFVPDLDGKLALDIALAAQDNKAVTIL